MTREDILHALYSCGYPDASPKAAERIFDALPGTPATSGDCICTPDQLQGSGHGVNCPARPASGDVEAARTLRVKGRTHTLGCQFAHVHSWPECFDDGVALRASTVTPGLDVERLRGALYAVEATMRLPLTDVEMLRQVGAIIVAALGDAAGHARLAEGAE